MPYILIGDIEVIYSENDMVKHVECDNIVDGLYLYWKPIAIFKLHCVEMIL